MAGQQCGTHPPGSTKNGIIILNIKFNNYILGKNMARARKEGQVWIKDSSWSNNMNKAKVKLELIVF